MLTVKDSEQILIELDRIVESLREYSHEENGHDIKFMLDRKYAVSVLYAYITTSYDRKKPDAFVQVGSIA